MTVPQDQSYRNLVVNDTLTAGRLIGSLVSVRDLVASSVPSNSQFQSDRSCLFSILEFS